ncbi:LuxR family transcriptional regulator [Streptomyces sp. NRRL S-337]|uniref:LuxR family transcriptional regulator n=1 Tax=Streptomyces sp. NRRL S-337 TaxID=1463900 RepID=UPI00069029CC|nr:LuxR family transcriptional regulator [Streptomyces sp. NRRL S-337]
MPEDRGAVPVLTGRDAHIAVIGSALADIRSTGTSVLLRGDPGMGKTALLKVAEAAARRAGLRVLRMTGAEAESGLPFAALHQVLWPLLDDTRALTAEQRDALDSALGLCEGTPPAGFTVAGAALTLLADAAARRPVVVLLDDLQWADPSSTAVFGHVRMHLARVPVVVIGATRHTAAAGRGDGTEGLPGPVIDLEPLDERHAERLLRTLQPRLPDGARRRVLRAAGGNPLALHELSARIRDAAAEDPAYLEEPPASGMTELFDELPLGERLGRLYEDRLRALPDGDRRLLLVAALGGSLAQRVSVLRDVADRAADTSRPDFQDRIEAAGLAYVDPDSGRVVFHHPLVRAGLVHIASPAERRAAHRLLADALPAGSPRRIMHLAAATAGTDGALAALVHEEADRVAARGAQAEAARTMARAAGLSPDAASRAARFVAAAALAARSGHLRLAADLVAEAESEAGPGRPEPAAVHAFVIACTRLQLDGDPTPSIELLPRALDLLAAPEAGEQRAALLDSVLFLLVVVAVYTGDERAWAATEHPLADGSALAVLCRRAWAGPWDTGHEVQRRLRAAVAVLPQHRETSAAWLLLWTAAAVDGVSEHDGLWSRFARRRAYAMQAFLDIVSAHDDFLHGDWDASLAVSRQGAETSAACGHAFNEMLFLQNVAQVLAARGDRAGLAELEPVLGASARERRMRSVTERLTGLKVLCALAHGRTEEAWQQARMLTAPGTVPLRSPWFPLSLVDWVQAAVDSGRRAEAQRHLRAVRMAGIARVSAHHAFLVAVAEALAADDEEAEQRYAAVYAAPGAATWPFPLARARLAHGAWLRRHGRGEAAAVHCEAALAAFTRIGAPVWAEQASREHTAAVAGTVPPGSAAGRQLLTAQELRIAELAAEGLTNRQIGERLGLSPRTIGAHLYRVFPKLGITTRAGVARALAEQAAPGPGLPAR